MSREVRRVPRDWKHPKDPNGRYVPLLAEFNYTPEEIEEGLTDGWLNKYMPDYGIAVMPTFADADATFYMMYETCSEGTPISPAVESEGDLAQWLADNNASWFGDIRATAEQWLHAIRTNTAGLVFLSRIEK